MGKSTGSDRRTFFQQAAAAVGASQISIAQTCAQTGSAADADYPRVFSGGQLKMIAFPLGGVGAGSISLGGRGQLRDWEIFNKPNKGFSPAYAFPAIWARTGNAKPVTRVLEARILPPYEGQTGLGSNNAPGLSRLESAKFIGEYPLARVDFEDRSLPVKVSLEAFSPFIPHEADESGLPVAVLRYRVTNPGPGKAAVSIAFSIDNPIKGDNRKADNQPLDSSTLRGLAMRSPELPPEDPMLGEFVLCSPSTPGARVDLWRGWPQGRWWNSPMLFWDDFSDDGLLSAEPDPHNDVGVLLVQRTIAPGGSAEFTFLLAWRFPNRTPDWCGWKAPKGQGKTIIGNHYCTRFPTALAAAEYASANLKRLESQTRLFARALRESTLPAVVKEAAGANLSTLASTTCFRTADGEFHGFEGVNDHSGCCFGNCTHVWNYEIATPHLFPSLARSLRAASFGYSMDDAGAMHFRQLLPDGVERSEVAAADGQMGQIVHAYLDWSLSGDTGWLSRMWPRIKKGLEFAWAPGGWDADKDGVLEGVQHNTYDVEFYGPNPMCGIYYLAALRAGEEMAQAVQDRSSAAEYRRLFESGSKWIDANLFNGEFYVQKIQGFSKEKIAGSLRSTMGSEDTEHPQYQVGEGCLVDQLVGQYLAEVAGLGALVSRDHIVKTLASIYRYNHKRSLANHDTVQRTFALNNEAAMVICDYGKAERPRIPFPYYAEVMTGFEYSTAAHMLYAGMVREGVECIGNIRARYDGEKRNPWDEAECGHHYARAMAAWSGVLALSGFRYHGPEAAVTAVPRVASHPAGTQGFTCFWSTGTGWGNFSILAGRGPGLEIKVLHGSLPCQSCEFLAAGTAGAATLDGKALAHRIERSGSRAVFRFPEPLMLAEGSVLRLSVHV
jgi:non-lysosomal glucosylceramidase